MNIKSVTVLLLLASSLMANPYQSKEEEIRTVKQTGQQASMTLIKILGGNLKKHLQSEGPIGAAKFCSTNAYPLTDKVTEELGKGVSVKRISLKHRNPANRPATKQESTVLESLQQLQDNGVMLPEYLIEQNSESYKYYKPLSINKGVCLKCHGDLSKNPELAGFMKEHYPEDKATGYSMGELRGAIVITIKR